jgi:hypothetical protein
VQDTPLFSIHIIERIVGARVTAGTDAIDTGDIVRTNIPGGSK